MKTFLYFLIALAIAGGLGYMIWNETEQLRKEIISIEQEAQKKVAANEYKGWKNFSSDKYAFAFKYPADWNVDAKESANSTTGFTVKISPGKLSENIFGNIVSFYTEGPGIGCTEQLANAPVKKEFEIGGVKKEVTDFCYTKTSWVLPVNLGGKAPQANIFISFAGYSEASQIESKLLIKSITNTKYR